MWVVKPRWLAFCIFAVSVIFWIAAIWLPGWREPMIVSGLALMALAGGVLNWDRRVGH